MDVLDVLEQIGVVLKLGSKGSRSTVGRKTLDTVWPLKHSFLGGKPRTKQGTHGEVDIVTDWRVCAHNLIE